MDLDHTFSAKDLRDGLELVIDACDVRSEGWDGRVTVKLKVRDGDREAKDSVELHLAPVLTHHHGQFADQPLTASDRPLNSNLSSSGLKKPLHVLTPLTAAMANH